MITFQMKAVIVTDFTAPVVFVSPGILPVMEYVIVQMEPMNQVFVVIPQKVCYEVTLNCLLNSSGVNLNFFI